MEDKSNVNQFQWLINELPDIRPIRLLNIGCGICLECTDFIQAGINVIGIDQDELSIKIAELNYPSERFINRNALTYDLEREEPADVIVFRRPDIYAQPEQWKRIFFKSIKWLKPNGKVILTTPEESEANLGKNWLEKAGYVEIREKKMDTKEEKILITATYGEVLIEEEEIVLPVGVVVWDDIDENICDIKTGMCK